MLGLAQVETTSAATIGGRRKKIHLVQNGGKYGVIVEDLASSTFISPNCGGPPGVFAALSMQAAFLTAVAWTDEPIARVRFDAICAGLCTQITNDPLLPRDCPCAPNSPVS